MNRGHKLRLKKQVKQILISIPIAICITTAIMVFIINKNNALSTEIEQKTEILEVNQGEPKGVISENRYLVELNDKLELRKKDNTIIYYAQMFKLNIDKTLEIAHTLTNNYTDPTYLQTFAISYPKNRELIGTFNNMEAGMIYFVRDLYRYPERYGSSIAEIRLSEEANVDKKIVDGVVYVDNGLTFEQYLGRICDLFGIDKTIALAIVYEETGMLKSGLFTYNNNVGGQKGYAGWLSYTTLEAGIIGHVIGLRGIIRNNYIDMSSPSAVSTLSAVYVNGNPYNPSWSWTEHVSFFIEDINKKDLFTIK